ncbi:MAG TPA: protocatechuate 3,4-dioxygenase, partial [Geminicoccaceae bacterium]|nr:protocatechuate 3,4-dioxygenase [Geminicoccaceae bacterium]
MGRLARRRLVVAGPAALAGAAVPSLLRAAGLLLTPPQTEGPFYPVELPSDRDADLVRVTGADARAIGIVTHVTGRVLDRAGRPLPGVQVEIWQCDANGRYRHPLESSGRPLDVGFQGYGRALTDEGGGYRFRTIRPVPYPGRTPHIHFKLSGAGGELLTTQMYVAGEPGNERDFLLNAVRDPDRRAGLIVDLRPAGTVEAGALLGTFD